MPKYLWRGSYTTQGLQGVLKEGGTARVDVIRGLIEGLGGTLEAAYYAFGEDDLFLIYDLPDNVAASAGSMIAAAGGGVRGSTIVLLSPEEIDEVTKESAAYRSPGG